MAPFPTLLYSQSKETPMLSLHLERKPFPGWREDAGWELVCVIALQVLWICIQFPLHSLLVLSARKRCGKWGDASLVSCSWHHGFLETDFVSLALPTELLFRAFE